MLDYAWRMKRPLMLLALLLLSPALLAQTGYRIVHPDGTVEFTDDPTRGGEEVELRNIPTYTAPAVSPRPATGRQRQTSPSARYQSISIATPRPDETVWFNADGMVVSVLVLPELRADDRVVVYLDGQEVARGETASFVLENVFRGAHTLRAEVVNGQGATLVASEPINFFLRQHTKRNP